MRLTGKTFGAYRRPALAGLALAFVMVCAAAGSAFAQAAPAQGQAAEKPALTFSHDAGLVIFFVKPDKTADFEDMMNKLKEGLAKMDAPEYKQQAASLRLFKEATPPAGATFVRYFMVADPIVKDVEYWFLPILYKAYPNDAQALFQKWQDIKVAPGQWTLDLGLVLKFQ
jgi:hypothetical protein